MRSEETRERFGRLVADAARRAGYDLEARGVKADLARKMNMSESSVGRMLRGEALPDPWRFQDIARVVNLDLRDLMIESNLMPPESPSTPSQTRSTGVGSDSITLDEVANALGIVDPVAREMLAATVERLRRIQDAERESDDSGGTAAHA